MGAPHIISGLTCVTEAILLFVTGAWRKQMPSTGNMATAMYRIASTVVQEASDQVKVMDDRRFQQLVLNVEHSLEQAPETFGKQQLANVVWCAAKLRLQRGPLFDFVQREVVSFLFFAARGVVRNTVACCVDLFVSIAT